MQAIRLTQNLLLSCATLALLGAEDAAAQETNGVFEAAPAITSCKATNTTNGSESSFTRCAVKCYLASSCLSFSQDNGTCTLSDSPYHTASGASIVWRRVRATVYPNPGYEQLIGGRSFWVFQQRQTGAVNFNRTWDEYERGFGDANEFWSGLQLIRSNSLWSCKRTLRIEMTTLDNVVHIAEWPDFSVSDASTNYTMNCGALSFNSGFSGDPMTDHRGMQFSTIDRDNDVKPGSSCSQLYGNGGFWFGSCLNMNPNGWYSLVDYSAASGDWKYGYMCTYWIGSCKPIRINRMMLEV